MHGSVLQNKKYIKFANENTVEVMSLSSLDKGIEKGDKRAATYKAKDGNEYLVGYPNLTVQQIQAMRSTKAGQYNHTGKIPYTAIVNPHTLEEMDNIKGGYGAGTLMDAVEAQKKELEKQYGKSVSRKKLHKLEKAVADLREDVEKGKLANALNAASKLVKSNEKIPALAEKAGKVRDEILKLCDDKLTELDALIGRGDVKTAKKELGPLVRALKGTSLEAKANDLLAKTKA